MKFGEGVVTGLCACGCGGEVRAQFYLGGSGKLSVKRPRYLRGHYPWGPAGRACGGAVPPARLPSDPLRSLPVATLAPLLSARFGGSTASHARALYRARAAGYVTRRLADRVAVACGSHLDVMWDSREAVGA